MATILVLCLQHPSLSTPSSLVLAHSCEHWTCGNARQVRWRAHPEKLMSKGKVTAVADMTGGMWSLRSLTQRTTKPSCSSSDDSSRAWRAAARPADTAAAIAPKGLVSGPKKGADCLRGRGVDLASGGAGR